MNTILSDDERREETDYDKDDETEHTNTVAFTIVFDMKDTTLQSVENCVDDDGNCVDKDESIYNDENDKEVTFEELSRQIQSHVHQIDRVS